MKLDPEDDDRRRIVEDAFDDAPVRPGFSKRPPRAEPAPEEAPPPSYYANDTEAKEDPVIVPPDALSADALTGLVEEFVTRHGTDLTESDAKTDQVRRLLTSGKVQIVFDPNTGTCNIVAADPEKNMNHEEHEGHEEE